MRRAKLDDTLSSLSAAGRGAKGARREHRTSAPAMSVGGGQAGQTKKATGGHEKIGERGQWRKRSLRVEAFVGEAKEGPRGSVRVQPLVADVSNASRSPEPRLPSLPDRSGLYGYVLVAGET